MTKRDLPKEQSFDSTTFHAQAAAAPKTETGRWRNQLPLPPEHLRKPILRQG